MFRPRFPKSLLIAFALLLASAPETRAAGNQQEAMEASATAGNLHDAPNLLPLIIPRSVICVLPGSTVANPREQRIQLAPGQKPLSACPPGAKTYIYLGSSPGRYPPCPLGEKCPPPADFDSQEREQDDLAQKELDAIAAAKLRNKSPGQQTPEQKSSGQPP